MLNSSYIIIHIFIFLGHFAMDCFVGKGNNQYELIPDIDKLTELPPIEEREQRKPKKKKKVCLK